MNMPPSLVEDPHTWKALSRGTFQPTAPNCMGILFRGATVCIWLRIISFILMRRIRPFQVDRPVPWASLPPGWSDMTRPSGSSYPSSQLMTVSSSQVPAAPNTYTAIDGAYSSIPNTNPAPLRLVQGPNGAIIVAQTDYQCSQPFPTAPLSQPCAYQAFRLSSANANNFDALSRPHEVAFPDVTFGQKVSCRIRVRHPQMHAPSKRS